MPLNAYLQNHCVASDFIVMIQLTKKSLNSLWESESTTTTWCLERCLWACSKIFKSASWKSFGISIWGALFEIIIIQSLWIMLELTSTTHILLMAGYFYLIPCCLFKSLNSHKDPQTKVRGERFKDHPQSTFSHVLRSKKFIFGKSCHQISHVAWYLCL